MSKLTGSALLLIGLGITAFGVAPAPGFPDGSSATVATKGNDGAPANGATSPNRPSALLEIPAKAPSAMVAPVKRVAVPSHNDGGSAARRFSAGSPLLLARPALKARKDEQSGSPTGGDATQREMASAATAASKKRQTGDADREALPRVAMLPRGAILSSRDIAAAREANSPNQGKRIDGSGAAQLIKIITPDLSPARVVNLDEQRRNGGKANGPLRKAQTGTPAEPLRPVDEAANQKLARALQRELKRIGCYSGPIDGDWGRGSKQAMRKFTRAVNATLPVSKPDYILLTLVQGHGSQACGAANIPESEGSQSASPAVLLPPPPTRITRRSLRPGNQGKRGNAPRQISSVKNSNAARRGVVTPELLAERRRARLAKLAKSKSASPSGAAIAALPAGATRIAKRSASRKAAPATPPVRIINRDSARRKALASYAAAKKKRLKALKPLPGRMTVGGPVLRRDPRATLQSSKFDARNGVKRTASRNAVTPVKPSKPILKAPPRRAQYRGTGPESKPEGRKLAARRSAKRTDKRRYVEIRQRGPIIRTPSITPSTSRSASNATGDTTVATGNERRFRKSLRALTDRNAPVTDRWATVTNADAPPTALRQDRRYAPGITTGAIRSPAVAALEQPGRNNEDAVSEAEADARAQRAAAAEKRRARAAAAKRRRLARLRRKFGNRSSLGAARRRARPAARQRPRRASRSRSRRSWKRNFFNDMSRNGH